MFHEKILLGLPSLAGYSLPDALAQTKTLGFQSVMSLPDGPRTEHSLGSFPTLGFYNLTEEEKRETAAVLASFKHVTIHQAWDNEWKKWIDCAACFGAEIVTIHSGRSPEGCSSSDFIAGRAVLLQAMADHAESKGIRIGIENDGISSDEYLDLIDYIGHPYAGATLDIGHCAYFHSVVSIDDLSERVPFFNHLITSLIKRLNTKLFSLHIHDVREHDWRDHRCVGSGVIDFEALFAALQDIAYTGFFEIELEEPDKEEAAKKTGEYLTRLCQRLWG